MGRESEGVPAGAGRVRILITGAAGFAGSYLAASFRQRGSKIYGITRKKKERGEDGLSWLTCDLRRPAEVHKAVRQVRPDRVFHLAAQSFVPASWEDPEETFSHNVFSTMSVLQAVTDLCPAARVHVACSAEEYGFRGRGDRSALKEDSALRPMNPYAVSKVSQDFAAYQYFLSRKLRVVRTRAFNHTGPGQDERFVLSRFAGQIARIEAGKQRPVLPVGNLEAIRDFTDVRDVVRAYRMVLEKGKPGEVYDVCSGKGRRIGDVLDKLLAQSRVKIRVRFDRSLMRSGDAPRLVGDASKLRRQTGWRPEIPFEKTLDDLLEDWRERVRRSV